jgi:D-lactate dehydrogenase
MIIVAVFNCHPFEQEFMLQASANRSIEWQFLEPRLISKTAPLAKNARVACALAIDDLDSQCLRILAAQGVQMVALRSTGFNNVDIAAARELNLKVTRVPVYSPQAVAEHAIALLLTLNRKIHHAYNRMRELNFSLNGLLGFDLHGKTVGIIGTGNIGRAAAQIFRGFGMRVLAFDLHPNLDWAKQTGVEYVDSVAKLTPESDVISLHVSLTPQTQHLVHADMLAMMKPGSFLVNVSRGALVDTKALIAALKSGHLGGAALDVYEREGAVFGVDRSSQILQDDDLAVLLTLPNVLMTSHQGGLTREALTEIARVTVTNIAAFDESKPFLEGTTVV